MMVKSSLASLTTNQLEIMLNIFISFSLTLTMLILLLKTPLVNFALDKPNERSLHIHHTPRTGGLALIIGVVIAWVIGQVDYNWIFLVLALVGVSLVDDVSGLSVRWRLLVQLIVSACFIWIFLPNLAWWIIAVALLGIVWVTNLYNFMDGSDGLAGGMGMFGFATYALLFYWAGDMQLALMCACISASCLAFLLFNFHPAKIFMGDSGSIPLGFLAGAIGLYGWQRGLWPAWFPLLVFSPFVVDATVTLFKRLLSRERLSEAHRSHYYQRLVQMGWGHGKTAITEYILMFAAGGSAVLLLGQTTPVVLGTLVFWVILYWLLMGVIDKRWSVRKRSNDAC